jgi:hypothetical protein
VSRHLATIISFLWGAALTSGWWAVAVFKPSDNLIMIPLIGTIITAVVALMIFAPSPCGNGGVGE